VVDWLIHLFYINIIKTNIIISYVLHFIITKFSVILKKVKAIPVFFCEAIGTAATPGLLCQPRVIMKMTVEKLMECRLAGETEVLGENLPPALLLSITKSHMTRAGFEPGPPRWETGD
jgi:hypothetical protein